LEDMNLTYDKHQVLCFVFTTRTLPWVGGKPVK
jgi:hypothetical protein